MERKRDPNTGAPAAAGSVHMEFRGMDRLAALGPEAATYIRQLTDKMPGGFFIYYAYGDEALIYANASLLQLFGCEDTDQFMALTGGTFPGMVHPDDLAGVQESIREQIAGSSNDLDYVEYRIIRRDGSVRWVEDYGHFTRNDYVGDIFYVFLADATEKRRTQLAILGQKDRELAALSQEQSQSLEMIQGLSVDYESIFYLDLETDTLQSYRLSRRVTRELSGQAPPYSFNQFARDYVARCVSPEDREMMARVLSTEHLRERLSRRSTYHMTYRVAGESGPEYLQLRCVNVDGGENASRVVLGVRLVDSEIVLQLDQKRLLEDALRQARAAEVARSTFLSNMSHDIRTPLNAIMGLAALVRTHAGDPERVRDYVGRIEDAGNQLIALLGDVLELSRLESGKISIEERPCRLSDVVGEVEKLRPQAEKKNIGFTVDLSGLKNGDVYGDPVRLGQVLLCLVGNAVKYTLPGGSVKLSVWEESREMRDYSVCRFRVEDTGVGISPAFIGRLYEPFERERSTTQCGEQGTGLGLPIAKSLVDRMGGTLDVESELGRGTAFTLTLSMRLHRPEPADDAPAEAEERNAFAGMRLLLVEDNEINIMIETELLQDAGFTVDVAENGQVAVDKVRNSAPGDYQLILMDIQMPVMDGREATRAIRALQDPELAGIPIVALSANAFDRDVRQSLECGMEAHLPKPLHIPQLLDQVARIVGEKSA